jgi:hypothetical protein
METKHVLKRERFCGIKKLATILPNIALFRIYEIKRHNNPARKRLEKFRDLVPGLETAEIVRVNNAHLPWVYYNHQIKIPTLEDNMEFRFNYGDGQVNSVKIKWFDKLGLTNNVMMIASFMKFKTPNISKIRIQLLGDVFDFPKLLLNAWKQVLSSIVVICDRFLRDIRPASMNVEIVTHKYKSQIIGMHTTGVRFVDALRAAAMGKMNALLEHKKSLEALLV